MTPQAIRDGFDTLRSDQQMLPLADAARSRSEADWLVGINGTRAMTAFNSRDGGFFLTTVGRVQTPTLAVVVEREEQIRKFISRDYWEVHATFGAQAGDYAGKWFDPKWKKTRGRCRETKADRVWSEQEAQAIADAVRGQTATVTEESKPTTQASPMLFDLTSLQREANGKFGFSAKTTLSHRAKPVRAPQGPDLPAYRLAPPAGRLPGRGQGHLRHAGRLRHEAPGAARRHRAQGRLRQAQQAHLRQRQGQRPLCHHPDAASAQRPERSRAEAVRPGGAPLHGGVLPQRRVPGHHPHHGGRRPQLQERGQGAGQAGLAGHLRQGSRGRADAGRGQQQDPGAGASRRKGEDAGGRAQGPEDPAARPLLGSHAALAPWRARAS